MKPINDDHFQGSSESLTRSEYRKRYQESAGANQASTSEPDLTFQAASAVGDEALSRQKLRQDKQLYDEEMKRQLAERKSKRLARRLDAVIGLLIIGIVIVLLVLFFVN